MTKSVQLITKFVIAATVALLLSSCKFSIGENGKNGENGFSFGTGIDGSGTITTESRTVSEAFTKIEVKQGINLIVEQSNDKSITVETDDNLQKIITTEVKNGILIIGAEENYNTNNSSPKVTVKLPTINGIETSSGSSAKSANTLISDNLQVKSSSGSDIDISAEADVLSLESSSGSKIKIAGKALKLETSSSSGSSIDAKDLIANNVDAQSSSGSDTKLAPVLDLKAKASSGSSILYFKTPKTITKTESSGGSISQK
jgi:hypothetical protein